MDTLVENLEVVLAGAGQIGHVAAGSRHQGIEVIESRLAHLGTVVDKLVAQGRQLGIVGHPVHTQPPLAKQRSHKRGNEATHVDKHIEYLESAVAFALGLFQGFGALLGSFGLEIVVELADDSLQVALEQTVTEGNEEERETGKREQPRYISAGGQNRNRQQHIASSHDNQTGLDGTFVVLRTVGNDTAHQCQQIDTGIKK